MIIAGRSSDFVLCSGRLETGDACPELVDKRTAIEGLCDHHLQLRAKLLAKRKPTSTGAQSSVVRDAQSSLDTCAPPWAFSSCSRDTYAFPFGLLFSSLFTYFASTPLLHLHPASRLSHHPTHTIATPPPQFFGRFREDQNRHLASQVSQSDRALATSLAAARKRSAGGGVGEQQRAAQKARLSLDVDEEKDAVHAGDPTLTALLSKLPGGIPAPNPNRPRTALEKKAREELRAARKTAAGGEGQRASAGGDASGDASASGSPVPRARGGAEGGKGGDVRQPRAGPRFRLSDVLEREEKPLAVAECGPEGHALDRGKMGPRKDGRSVLGPGGHGGASGDAKRSAFAEKVGEQDGANV